MKGIGAVLVLTIVALTIFAASAIGQVPQKMNYQVMLTNDSDEPLADAAVTLVFRLYDHEVAGSQVWTETHNTNTNSIGVVSVTLGDNVTLGSHLFDEPLWLEVVVDGETLTPRRELVSSPYALFANDAHMLGNELAEDYVLDSDLMTGGVINTPSNPVDWTKLKNVPAGFADGSDASGGTGDGHSLDASDGNPVDALYVDATGNVGIGLTSPAHKFSVYHGSGGFTYGQFANATTGTAFGDGLIIGVNASGTAYINQGESNPMVFMTSLTERHSIEADGTFKFGSPFSAGVARFYVPGIATSLIDIYGTASYGGNIDLYDETGNMHSFIEADVSGAGGFLTVYDGNGYNTFTAEGYYSGGDGRVIVDGSTSTTVFNTFNSGDTSVDLPPSSVAAYEMFNEPGVTSTYSTSYTSLTGPVETLLSNTISCPSNGFVLVIATVDAEADHTYGGYTSSFFGVSSSSSSFPTGGAKVRACDRERSDRNLWEDSDGPVALQRRRRDTHLLLPRRHGRGRLEHIQQEHDCRFLPVVLRSNR